MSAKKQKMGSILEGGASHSWLGYPPFYKMPTDFFVTDTPFSRLQDT